MPAAAEPSATPEFPKAYDPAPAETRWYTVWEEAGVFSPEVNPDGEPFCIVIPPPNVTGSLHMGHAFEHALIDATIRHRRMQGYAALWLPGTDHAGIATQNVVEREIAKEGLNRHDLGRQSFIERVWRFKEESGGQITQQMRRMGSSCDWSRERFTMDEGLSHAVRLVFVGLYEEDLIYRANRIINWCPRCHTALSDIEVEHEEVEGELCYFRYPFTDGTGHVTVATTRAETMLGDTAVAVNPDDDRYRDAVGKTLKHPFFDRELVVVADDVVDPEFGTGAVKVTPAHDPNDFDIAQRHDLEAIDIFDESANITEAGGERFVGQDRFSARMSVKEALEEARLLEKVEAHHHAIGHCYRCHTVVEPRLSLQWFVRVRPLTIPAIDAVKDDRTRFIPERWEKLYFDWMENLRDWCVSRQIWWGHRIPAWYCPDGHVTVSMDEAVACGECGSKEITQDEDVLDTWFSSALWPFTTLGWPDDTADLRRYYPNAVLHTGFDIITFWVARMMQMGIHFAGDVPFAQVAIHGLVRDADGRKMSKSFGNVVDPLELAGRYGADALRFALTRAASPGQDVPLAEEWVDGGRKFINKLWNASRFVHQNLDGQTLSAIEAAGLPDDLALADRWILSRLATVIESVERGFTEYDFAEALRDLYAFTWGEFCDWYIELAKLPLNAGGAERARTQAVLGHVLSNVLRLLHPVVPFATEELWERLGGDGLCIVARWPQADGLPRAPDAETAMGAVVEIVTAVRTFRSEQTIPPSKRFPVHVVPADDRQRDVLASVEAEILALAGLDAVVLETERAPQEGEHRMVAAGAEVIIPLEGVVDVEAARTQIDRQIGKLNADLERVRAKLASDGFVAKAPADVVEKERRKEAEAADALDALRAQRALFG